MKTVPLVSRYGRRDNVSTEEDGHAAVCVLMMYMETSCCRGFTLFFFFFGNIHTEDMEASAGLMIVTGPSECVLLTHTYITPPAYVCVCLAGVK